MMFFLIPKVLNFLLIYELQVLHFNFFQLIWHWYVVYHLIDF